MADENEKPTMEVVAIPKGSYPMINEVVYNGISYYIHWGKVIELDKLIKDFLEANYVGDRKPTG